MTRKSISHYEIIEKMGEGGMGEVYKARDVMLDRIVAIKMLPDSVKSDPDKIQRFMQEAKAASALDHPNICTIYEIDDTSDGQMFIVMAHYEGETLKEKIAQGALQIAEAAKITAQIADGLSKAHRQGIVHRDIKPANIIVTNDGLVKILDFGLAKISGHDLTKTDTSMGTLGYASPEQLKGENVDQRTDIWSLGVVLYELLTGKQPFAKTEHPEAIYFSIMNEEPKNLATINENIPESLLTIIDNALAKAPDDRYQQMEEMLADLKSVRAELSEELNYSQVTRLRRNNISKSTLIVSLIVVLSVIAGLFYVFNSNKTTKNPTRIAVLPIANFSNNPENDYLADGMTDELINKLSRINNIRVIARTSAMQYKNTTKTISQIGEELNVQTIVDGSLKMEDNRFRIAVQLIDVSDQLSIWSKEFYESVQNTLDTQSNISIQIANALTIEVLEKDVERVFHKGTENSDAYKLYLRGRDQLRFYDENSARKAIAYFNAALEIDPNYAEAYAGIANCYYNLSSTYLPSQEAMPNAMAAAKKALEINNSLSDAHAMLAAVNLTYFWDWVSAEEEFKLAIQFNPSSATARCHYGIFLVIHERFEEAILQLNQAKQDDPLSLVVETIALWPYYYGRKFEEAIEKSTDMIKIEPNFFAPYGILALSHLQIGNISRAIEELERAIELSDTSNVLLGYLGYGYAVAGMAGKAQIILDHLLVKQKNEEQDFSAAIALVYNGLGNKNQAFEWLEKACDNRFADILLIKVDPIYDSLRSDPRFTALLKKMGFEQ